MPKHWRPIDPDNPDPKARAKEVRDTVEGVHKGKLEFCGYEKGTRQWWALVDVKNVGDSDQMWKDVRSPGPGKVLVGEDEF
jgi:hypothetical protein